uniref:NPH3 domain-containing protein n=1 Tax=Solanum lycopersicum TaxID=4081 RepID=A0A3Q7FD70_SOLLC
MFSNPKSIVNWWSEDLTVLRIDFFQRVLIAMMGRGFKQYALGPILMLYAQKSLRCLEIFGKGRKKIEPKQEHEKRVVVETIVGLLPREKNALSVSFCQCFSELQYICRPRWLAGSTWRRGWIAAWTGCIGCIC